MTSVVLPGLFWVHRHSRPGGVPVKGWEYVLFLVSVTLLGATAMAAFVLLIQVLSS